MRTVLSSMIFSPRLVRLLRRFPPVVGMVVVMAVSGCDVHEFPDPEPVPVPKPPVPPYPGHEPNVEVRLTFDTEMPLFKLMGMAPGGRNLIARSGTEMGMRHVAAFYKADASKVFSRDPDCTMVLNSPLSDTPHHEFQLYLERGEWRVIVFTDHVPTGSHEDHYYVTADFAAITHASRDNYRGDTDMRMAFTGSADFSVREHAGRVESEVTVAMAPPQAKYRFISTDLDVFLERETAFAAMRNRAPGDIDLSDYRVKVRYGGYFPSVFNIFTDRPADSWLGVSYPAKLSEINETEAHVAMDYVFVNHHDTSVNAGIEVYDSHGTLISQAGPFDIPLRRGHVTMIKGNFLTSKATGGLGINPDFDGSFDIEIK